MSKVFLGGTCNESQWREEIKPLLRIDFFDPVVPDWNDQAYQRELVERETCDFVLYVLTPKMTGTYAVAEVVDDSNKRPGKTLLCVLPTDGQDQFTPGQLRSLQRVSEMVAANGATIFKTLEEAAEYLNGAVGEEGWRCRYYDDDDWTDWEHRWPDEPGFWWFYGGIKVYLQLWGEVRINQQAGKDPPTAWYRPVRYPEPPQQKAARSMPDLNRPQEYKGPPRMDLK